jgi:hypothetical protein
MSFNSVLFAGGDVGDNVDGDEVGGDKQVGDAPDELDEHSPNSLLLCCSCLSLSSFDDTMSVSDEHVDVVFEFKMADGAGDGGGSNLPSAIKLCSNSHS